MNYDYLDIDRTLGIPCVPLQETVESKLAPR